MRVITTAAMVALGAVLMGWLPISTFMAPEEAPPEVRKQARFEKAAAEICGVNAAWADLGNGVIECFQHNGRRAGKVAIK